MTHIAIPGTAKFNVDKDEGGFLCFIKTECAACFYNCTERPDTKRYNITVETREDNPFAE